MVLEIADFRIKADLADEFPAAVERGIGFVAGTPGFRSAKLSRSIESPDRFVLLIEWDSVEAHTKSFRESDNFPKWRGEIGSFFAGDPFVEHFEVTELPG